MGNQTIKAEIDASMQVMNQRATAHIQNNHSSSTRYSKNAVESPVYRPSMMTNQSTGNQKLLGDKDKLKLSWKNIVFEKPAPQRRKPNLSICSPSRIEESELKQPEKIPEEIKVPHIVIEKTAKVVKPEPEVDINERVRAKFTRAMNEKMDEVIKDLENYNQKFELGRKIIKDRISEIVNRSFKGTAYVQEYGSYASRLLTPYSDMDLSIQGCQSMDREQIVETLQFLSKNLKMCSFIKNATSILTAAVPVIKIEADSSVDFETSQKTDTPLTIHVDIILDTRDNINHISTALRTTDYMKYCIRTYPSFYKNMLFMKYAMNCNELNNTYRGGLCAYGLAILYVAYIESHNIEKSTDHFELLRGFIHFMVAKFNPETQAVFYGTAFR